MIQSLSGCEHEVITGVTLRSADRRVSFSSHSKVRFRRLSLEEIEYYVDTYAPMDKAGAYGIQEWIGYVGIEGIEGSFFNVMGLPVQRLYCELDAFIG
jgi:septum formation protein